MRPVLLLGVLLLLPTILVLAPAAPAPTPPPKEASKPNPVVAKLHERIEFNGFEADPKLTLQEALDKLGDLHGLEFDVNEAAFQAEMVEDVLSKPVAEKAIPKMVNTSLDGVLRKVLARIPFAVYVIRPDHVEVTTAAAMRNEFWGPNYPGPYLPLIHATFDRRPLDEAAAQLADEAGWNVVIDGGLGEKARTPVTARLFNVPVDTAVRLLADMAGLKAYAVDNVLYVTTPEKAAAMEKREQEWIEKNQAAGPRVGSGRFIPPTYLPAAAGM